MKVIHRTHCLFLSSALAVAPLTTVILPASANSVQIARNERLTGISRADLESYCKQKLDMTFAPPRVFDWGERMFSCVAEVRGVFRSQAEAKASFRNRTGAFAVLKGVRLGTQLSTSFSALGKSQVEMTVRSVSRGINLTTYCRDLYTTGRIFNPFTGSGRIFVAEGGKACHKQP